MVEVYRSSQKESKGESLKPVSRLRLEELLKEYRAFHADVGRMLENLDSGKGAQRKS